MKVTTIINFDKRVYIKTEKQYHKKNGIRKLTQIIFYQIGEYETKTYFFEFGNKIPPHMIVSSLPIISTSVIHH